MLPPGLPTDQKRHNLDPGLQHALEQATQDLTEKGFTQLRDLFSPAETASLRAEAQALHREEKLIPAKVGRGRERIQDLGQRNDSTLWWKETPETEAQALVFERWNQIREHLNRSLFLGLKDFEAHWAIYPVGGFYRKHIDRFREDDARILSAVLYLNPPDWKAVDGGALRVWPEGLEGSECEPIEIQPLGGSMALFLSDRIPHEVLPTNRIRYSVAAWFRR